MLSTYGGGNITNDGQPIVIKQGDEVARITVYSCSDEAWAQAGPPGTEVPEFGGLIAVVTIGLIGTALILSKQNK